MNPGGVLRALMRAMGAGGDDAAKGARRLSPTLNGAYPVETMDPGLRDALIRSMEAAAERRALEEAAEEAAAQIRRRDYANARLGRPIDDRWPEDTF
jgi:hypothetical protein